MRHVLPILSAAAALAVAGPAAAQPPRDALRTLSVSGMGEAAAQPDQATLTIGVEAEGRTAAEAVRQMSERMSATLKRLRAGGVAERDIQTAGLSVAPRYNYENRQTPQIVGYVAANSVSVRMKDPDRAGAVIDAAVQDGANTMNGLVFGFADAKPLENRARAAAVADARAKAETIAKAAGVSLGPIVRIVDGAAAGPEPVPMLQARAMAAEAKAVPIAAGESTISANVTLIYEIR